MKKFAAAALLACATTLSLPVAAVEVPEVNWGRCINKSLPEQHYASFIMRACEYDDNIPDGFYRGKARTDRLTAAYKRLGVSLDTLDHANECFEALVVPLKLWPRGQGMPDKYLQRGGQYAQMRQLLKIKLGQELMREGGSTTKMCAPLYNN